ncbi:hypothetical protein ACKAV7_005386 [Fusarium commune]
MYALISMILPVGLLASIVIAAPDTNGKCRVHITQSASNWVDRVEIFDKSGTSIGNSWGDSRYKSGACAKAKMDLDMIGKGGRLLMTGYGEYEAREFFMWDLNLEYNGHNFTSRNDADCFVGGWDDTKGARKNLHYTSWSLYLSIYRQMDCFFEC